MKPRHVHPRAIAQQGMIGILISGVLSAALILSSAQGMIKSNMDAYHSPNKVKIEVANQLMQSGLRYSNFLLNDNAKLVEIMDKFKNDPTVALKCDVGLVLPDDLQPTKIVDSVVTPETAQKIQIKGVFAPYDCDHDLDITNFRLTFEIVGSTGCNASNAESAEQCVTRSVVMTAYNGETYNPVKSPPPPPPPPLPPNVVVVVVEVPYIPSPPSSEPPPAAEPESTKVKKKNVGI